MADYEDTIVESADDMSTTMIPTTMIVDPTTWGMPWYAWVLLAVLLLGCCARAEKRYQQ